MDKMREKHIMEMERLKAAIERTTSKYLKRDYSKKLLKMQDELNEYDLYKKSCTL